MPDEYTNAAVYGNANVNPSDCAPETWVDGNVRANTVAGLVARMATGALTDSDDYSRVMGQLGGTADDVTLHRRSVEVTGGPQPQRPVDNPAKPSVSAEIADAPEVATVTAKRRS